MELTDRSQTGVTEMSTETNNKNRVAPEGVAEYDPNFDFEDRIKASGGSLRELIVIFTGLTITASFTVFIARHFGSIEGVHHDSIVFTYDAHLRREIYLLVLLLLCVMRFYYGNVMILDRYYNIPKPIPTHGRSFGLDSMFIVIMTFGLAVLGLVVHFPLIFFWVYALITASSVVWLVFNIRNIIRESRKTATDARWHEEVDAQMWWLIFNGIVLLIFALILPVGSMWNNPADFKDYTTFELSISTPAFNCLLFTAYAGSLADFVINRNEYFPRLR